MSFANKDPIQFVEATLDMYKQEINEHIHLIFFIST